MKHALMAALVFSIAVPAAVLAQEHSSVTMGIAMGFWDTATSVCTQQLSTPTAHH